MQQNEKSITGETVGLEDLELLGSIKPGDTVCVHSLSIAKHNSWATSFWRTYNFENRLKTLAWVGKVVNFAIKLVCENYGTYDNCGNALYETIWKMKIGIENLSETYKDDPRCGQYLKGYIEAVSSIIFDTNEVILKYKEEKTTKPISFVQMKKEVSEFVIVPVESTMSMPEKTTMQPSPPSFGNSVTPWNYFSPLK